MPKNQLPLFAELLQSKQVGDKVTRQEILSYTGWKPATFDTHIRKNKLVQWLQKVDKDSYIVRMNGENVTESDVASALKQVTAVTTSFGRHDRLFGEDGTYILNREVGRGATAHVWTATCQDGSPDVAAKICEPRPDLLDPAHFSNVQRRFKREAENGKEFNHDCIIKIIDYGEHNHRPFTVLELATTSVADILKATGPLTPNASVEIIKRCLEGLQYLHGGGCFHRDVKPANILKTDRGFVVADLGIVRWDDMNPAFMSAGTITRASLELGSMYYMSPEQRANPHAITEKADVYSLGVTWHHMLTRESLDPTYFVMKAYSPPSSHESLNKMIGQMGEFKPEDRPTIEELIDFCAHHLEQAV